jgi:hypothetical protein
LAAMRSSSRIRLHLHQQVLHSAGFKLENAARLAAAEQV